MRRHNTPAWPTRSFLGELRADLRERIQQLGTTRRYVYGDVVLSEQEPTTEAYIILDGFVRVINHSVAGADTVIAIRTRGDLVGELAALDGAPRVSTVIAAGRLLVGVIDAVTFRSFVAQHREAGDAVARAVVRKLRSATRYRVETKNATVLIRVARVLAHLAEGYGRATDAGLLIEVPLPQRDLAGLVGTSERGVQRAYQALRRDKTIEVRYRQVTVLDVDQLRRHAESEP